jgi:hypothetical protein
VALGAHAYIVSRNGAKKLIENLEGKIYNHIDYCMQDLASKGVLNVYAITPRVAYQTSTDTSKSTNVKSRHPLMLTEYLDMFELDTKVRASYITTLSLMRIGDANVNIMSIVFLILGLILALYKMEINIITIIFVLVSFKDLTCDESPCSIIWIHYFLIVMPSILAN